MRSSVPGRQDLLYEPLIPLAGAPDLVRLSPRPFYLFEEADFPNEAVARTSCVEESVASVAEETSGQPRGNSRKIMVAGVGRFASLSTLFDPGGCSIRAGGVKRPQTSLDSSEPGRPKQHQTQIP